jgi:hypothetical protein
MPKGRFFKAIFNYLLKDTGLIIILGNAIATALNDCNEN